MGGGEKLTITINDLRCKRESADEIDAALHHHCVCHRDALCPLIVGSEDERELQRRA